MIDALFAWSSGGHAQLTSMGLALAISWFVPRATNALRKRLVDIWPQGPIRLKTREQKEIDKKLAEIEKRSPTADEECLSRLFFDLPGQVVREDLHLGNIPKIGEWFEKDSQVRHFMRSRPSVSPRAAFDISTKYIRTHGQLGWLGLHKVVEHIEEWKHDFFNPATGTFNDAEAQLAKALHTIQDSFAPGHVQRREGTGVIETVHIWDAENQKPDKSRNWPGHEALDNPDEPLSRPFFLAARSATADFLSAVLGNLDKDQTVFLPQFDNYMARYFAFSPPG